MNLEDVIDPDYGLQQDEWSLSKPKFGDEGQLEVVGWSGKTGCVKYYILKCNKCSKDNELFGEGYFRSSKGNLVRGKTPCGCSKKPGWTKEQYAILCTRKAKILGYSFLGFAGEWKGTYTKIRMLCEKHGEWGSGTIHNSISSGHGCPGCRLDSAAKVSKKTDSEMIVSFFASGAFHPDTHFWRSERKSKAGRSIWHMSCPECGETGESFSGNLQRGQRSCACNMHRQQEAYINFIIEDNNCIAIKFGIARESSIRVQKQNSKSSYTLKQHSVYSFPSVETCKAAERECKQTLECGVVLKRDMPDGYTETTFIYNLDKIKQIYSSHGGVCIYNSEDTTT